MRNHRHRGRTLITIVTSGWHVVLKRARAGWMILSAAFLTMLLATTLLAAAPIYARAVAEAGLRRELRDAPVTGANLQVSLSLPGSSFQRADEQVRQALGPIIDLTHGSGSRAGFSSSFGLPGPNAAGGNQRLAIFAFFDRLPEHAKLVAGSWPADGAGPVQAALPEPAAKALKLGVGDQLKLTDRIHTDNVVPVRISGIYRVDNPKDPIWFADPLSQTGIQSGQSFTSYGPFVVTTSAFLGNISQTPATIDWRVFPDFTGISVGQAGKLEQLVNALPGRESPVLPGVPPQITTSLGTILSTTSRSLLVTRTAVLLLTIQPAILSGYALVLTAGLLTEQRQTEYALLESRGASRGQLVTMALLEGLLLAIPAVVIGPFLAAVSLRALNVVGPLSGIGLTLNPAVNRSAVLLAILGGIVCLLALVRPALFPPKPLHERSATRSILQRAGLDGGLLVIAAIGYWQLKHYGSPLTKTVRGSYGFDPLLVAAPAIGLLAGAVIALRLIPLFAQAADRLASKGSRVVFPLGAWQVARRPLRYARAALLLTLAVAIGLFAIAYSRTWNQSQADQAAYQVGAGIRLSPDQRPGAIPGIDLASAERTVPGVTASMPVGHQYLSLPGGSNVAQLLLLDAKAAPGIVKFRPDLANASFSTMMQRLAAGKPKLSGVAIPGDPARLRLGYTLHYIQPKPYTPPPAPPGRPKPPPVSPNDVVTRLTAIIQDGSGTLRSFDLGTLDNDGKPHQLVLPLAFSLSNTQLARPRGPLQLVQLQLGVYPPNGPNFTGTLHLSQLAVSNGLTGDQWTSVPLRGTKGNLTPGPKSATGSVPEGAPQIRLATAPPGQLAATIVTGANATAGPSVPISFTFTPSRSTLPAATPVLVNDAFLHQLGLQPGGTFPLQAAGATLSAKVAGTFTSFPTIDPSQLVVVADEGTFDAMALLQHQLSPIDPDERWLAVDPSQSKAATAALQAAPFSSPTVASLVERRQALQTDPVALGTIGALSLGFIAALIFAGIGFTVSAAVSVHERLGEFATLRALGLSPRQLAGWLMLEQGILIGLSLLGGTIVGLALAWLALPLITVTQAGAQVVPSLLVEIPWPRLVGMEAIIVVLLAIVVAIAAMLLRRIGIGQVLRMGVE